VIRCRKPALAVAGDAVRAGEPGAERNSPDGDTILGHLADVGDIRVAAAAHRPTQLGSNSQSHVGTAAGVHVVAALANVQWNELVGPQKLDGGVGELSVDGTTISVSGPGLGVDVDRSALAAKRIERTTVE